MVANFTAQTLQLDREQTLRQLELLGDKPDKVYLTAFFPKGDPRTKGENRDKGRKAQRLNYAEVEGWQAQGRGVYLVANGYGHGKEDVKLCRTIFYEHDNLEKDIQLTLWQTLRMPEPTFQVDSGGISIHNYWVLEEPIHPELWAFQEPNGQWKGLQADLLELADADRSLVNPNRVMRLAGAWYFTHDENGTHPVAQSRIVGGCGKRYSYAELRGIIPRSQPTFTRSLPPNQEASGEGLLDFRTIGQLLPHWDERGRKGWATFQCPVHTGDGAKHSTDQIHVNLKTGQWEAHCGCDRKIIYQTVCDMVGHRPTGRSFSGGIGSGGSGGNRRGNGGSNGSGGDGGDGGGDGGGKVIKHPSFNPISPEELAVRLDGLIQEGLSGAKLTNRLNHLAEETGRHVIELRKQYSERLLEVEREEDREDTQSQVNALIDASKASIDLREVLPCSLAEPLLKLAGWLNLKPECYLTALLTTTSILHKAGTKIVLNKEWDFEVTPNLYSAIIAASSQKKSPIIKAICTKPLKQLQQEALKEYKQDLQLYQEELKEWEATNPEDRGQPPVKPERKIYFFTKTTGEGLTYQAARCPEQGMLYLTDELAGMLNAQNQYRGGKGSDKQDLLSYYDGSGDVVLRAEGIKSEVDFILLGLLGGIQPRIMQKLLDDCSDSDGGWARFMLVNQPNAASRMSSDGGKYDLSELLSDLYRKIDALPPTEYCLSPKAFRLFCKAYNRLEELRASERLEGMQSVWGKSEGRIGKLAVNLHVIHAVMRGEIPSKEIPVEIVRIAINLTKFYAQQVQSLYTQFSDPDALAPQLVKVIELSRKKGWLKASDVYLSITKKSRPSGETVREWFSELVVMGKGKVRNQGRSLQFRAFLPNESPPTPPTPLLDKLDKKLDDLSNAEHKENQEVQEILDKLDKLDNFQKVGCITQKVAIQAIEVTEDSTTGLEKNSVLDELSNSSKIAQNTQPVEETALDDLSNKSSNLDAEPSTVSAVEPTAVEGEDEDEWMQIENLRDMAQKLEACDEETLSILRESWPAHAMNAASKLLSPESHARIKQLVLTLNQAQSQPTQSPESKVNSRIQYDEYSGRIAAESRNGGFFITWDVSSRKQADRRGYELPAVLKVGDFEVIP